MLLCGNLQVQDLKIIKKNRHAELVSASNNSEASFDKKILKQVQDDVLKNMQKKQIIIFSVILAIATVVMRLYPHPWNFSPMGALFLFSGFYLPRKWMLLPLITLSVTDLIIGTYQIQVMMVVYGSYAIMMFGAHYIRSKGDKMASVFGLSIASAILFFITTNFAHWMFFGGYAHNISGLMQAYVAGIPFFRNSLIGYVFYSAMFFGVYELVNLSSSIKQKTSQIEVI